MTRDRLAAAAVLVLLGGAGFYLGKNVFGNWQYSLETSQVLAGLVKYPPSNPFYVYHVKLWTLINQIPAILLRLGYSERSLSLAMSGLIGLLYMQALGLLLWGLSRSFPLSVGGPFVLLCYVAADYTTNSGRYWDSVVYPMGVIESLGNTYGSLGLAFVLMVYALFACGWYRVGSLFLGVAPSVHPTLGAGCLISVGLAVLLSRDKLGPRTGIILRFTAVGLACTAASLLVQLGYIRTAEMASGREVSDHYLRLFAARYDMHRQPVNLVSWGMAAHGVSLAAAALALRSPRGPSAEGARLAVSSFAVVPLCSAILCLLSHFQEALPLEFTVAMPGRLQNLVLTLFPAVIMGLLGARRDGLGSALLACLLGALSYAYHYMIRIEYELIPMAASLLLILALVLEARGLGALRGKGPAKAVFDACCLVVLSLVVVDVGRTVIRKPPLRLGRDWTNSVGYGAIRAGTGLLLTASDLGRVQLLSRRPVLLDGGALNELAYAPEAGALMEAILTRVYGVDLFSPYAPSGGRGSALRRDDGKALWQARTQSEWVSLAHEFGFTNVLTYEDWQLNLPFWPYSPPGLVLYRVPTM